jgi:hypothetical protein
MQHNCEENRLIPFGGLRARMYEEPITIHDHPKDLRLELENTLECARTAVTSFGGLTPVAIFYSSDKRVVLEFEVKDDSTGRIAKAYVKTIAEKLRATTVVVAFEGWVRPSGSISKEDPRREEALIAIAKNATATLRPCRDSIASSETTNSFLNYQR